MLAVEAGHRDRNLHAQSRTAPGRFRGEYFHLPESTGDLLCPQLTSLTDLALEAGVIKSG